MVKDLYKYFAVSIIYILAFGEIIEDVGKRPSQAVHRKHCRRSRQS